MYFTILYCTLLYYTIYIYTLFSARLMRATSEEELQKKVQEERERVACLWNIAGTNPFTLLVAIMGIPGWQLMAITCFFAPSDSLANQKRIENMKTT